MDRRRTLVLGLALVASGGCALIPPIRRIRTPEFLRGTSEEARETLLRYIPVGLSRESAERMVEFLGLETRPQFAFGPEARDTIHCRYRDDDSLFQRKTWIIGIDCPDGAVADIRCAQIIESR